MKKNTVVYDACIFYPAPLRDLFVRLAITQAFQARWSLEIHDEWMRNILKNRPDLTKQKLAETCKRIDLAIPSGLVVGYQKHIRYLDLPDQNDRHVLAVAIQAKAQKIITFNLTDFPQKNLATYNIVAQHPDMFLLEVLYQAPGALLTTIFKARSALKKPPKTTLEYLETLQRNGLPRTATYLLEFLDRL